MKSLVYKVIKSESQYDRYCKILEDLVNDNSQTAEIEDEIELITVLIEKWDSEHFVFNKIDSVELLHSLMKDHNLKAKDLVGILGVSKGLVSDILNYKKGFSKDVIRVLSEYFKVSQEAFNRPYKLKNLGNSKLRNVRELNTWM